MVKSCEVRTVDATRMLVDLVRRSCYAVQPAVTKRNGTAVRKKAPVMLPLSCYAGSQLEVAKRTVLAA